jgi:glycosyl transferase family 25
MESQLTASGLIWEFVEGVDGRGLSTADWSALVDADAVERWPGWLTPGAIGCILSHKRVYELVAADSEPALVLEDDAVLPEGIAPLASQIASVMARDEVALLNFRSFGPCRLSRVGVTAVGAHELMSPLDAHQPIGTLAYVIGPEAAAQMAEIIVPIRWAADSWSEYVDAGALSSLRCVVPRPVTQARTMRSTIRHGEVSGPRAKLLDSWPVHLTRQLNRRRIAWLMNRIDIVD